MGTQIKKGQSVFFLFKDGKTMYDSQMKPRMYITRKGYEQHTRTPIEVGAELIEYAPVAHAKWVKGETWEFYRCSNCHHEFPFNMIPFTFKRDFCPCCGARMDLED